MIKDFLALTVILEIDNYFAIGTGDSFARKICTDGAYSDLLTVDVTTSRKAVGKGNRELHSCPIHEKVLDNANFTLSRKPWRNKMAAWNDKYPYKYWSDELKVYMYIETDEEILKYYG